MRGILGLVLAGALVVGCGGKGGGEEDATDTVEDSGADTLADATDTGMDSAPDISDPPDDADVPDETPEVPSGMLVVDPSNPRWLMYEGGPHHWMCAPGDPEGFLYRGTRNADGTRDGDQMDLINKLAPTGANGIYFQAVRSHGGDAGSDITQNPFVDSDEANGLDEDILDQWETWFTAMDAGGIVQYFFFFDDSACIWGCDRSTDDASPSEERTFLQAVVDRFEHHQLLIWVIAEEYSEAFNAQRASDMAAVIRAADDHDHPIAVHKLNVVTFTEFADDPNIDQFSIQYTAASATDFDGVHDAIVSMFTTAGGRYNLNLAELHDHGTGQQARLFNWAIAMGGAYSMMLGWDIASTAVSDLEDCGRLVSYMESTTFDSMWPSDALALGDTTYVLANPADNFILYARDRTGDMGVQAVDAGDYDLTWLDAASGTIVDETSVSVAGGDTTFTVPSSMGAEVAVWIRQSG